MQPQQQRGPRPHARVVQSYGRGMGAPGAGIGADSASSAVGGQPSLVKEFISEEMREASHRADSMHAGEMMRYNVQPGRTRHRSDNRAATGTIQTFVRYGDTSDTAADCTKRK